MADWGPWIADRVLFSQLHSAVTPGSSAHTKGAWVAGANSDRGDGIYLQFPMIGNHSTARTLLLDVGVGSPEIVLISNLMLCPPSVGGVTTQRETSQTIYFPVSAPPGYAIKVRAQASMASHQGIYVTSTKASSGLPVVGQVVDTYGANVAATKGVTLTAPSSDGSYGSWTEITASCERIKAMMIACGHGQADWTTFSDQWYQIQIGVGGAGSEQNILTLYEAGASSSATGTVSQMVLGPYYVDIAPGSRLSARVGKQYSSASQRTLDVVLYGIR